MYQSAIQTLLATHKIYTTQGKDEAEKSRHTWSNESKQQMELAIVEYLKSDSTTRINPLSENALTVKLMDGGLIQYVSEHVTRVDDDGIQYGYFDQLCYVTSKYRIDQSPEEGEKCFIGLNDTDQRMLTSQIDTETLYTIVLAVCANNALRSTLKKR